LLVISKLLMGFLNELEKNGYTGYIVGGAVRDYILDEKILDYDVLTDAPLEYLKENFSEYKLILVGKRKDLLLLVKGDEKYEIVSYSGTPLEKEMLRRDFTINTLLIDLRGKIYDVTQKALKDMSKDTLKTPLTPLETILDDPIRILRALRFLIKYDMEMDKELEKTIRKEAFRLRDMPKERILNELRELFLLDELDKVLIELDRNRILKENFKFNIEKIKKHRKRINSLAKDFELRFYVILEYYTIEKSLNLLELSSKMKKIMKILEENSYEKEYNNISLKIIMSEIGSEIERVFKLWDYQVDEKKNLRELKKAYREILDRSEPYRVNDLKINGNDLIEEFGVSGIKIKELLELAKIYVINNPYKNSKENIFFYLKNRMSMIK